MKTKKYETREFWADVFGGGDVFLFGAIHIVGGWLRAVRPIEWDG